MYSRSRINLGFGGIGHFRKIRCLKGRDFEVPMSGGFYLTSRQEDLAECFREGEEIALYDDKWECLEKVRYYLDHPEEARRIAAAARRRALRDHTWEKRILAALAMVGYAE